PVILSVRGKGLVVPVHTGAGRKGRSVWQTEKEAGKVQPGRSVSGRQCHTARAEGLTGLGGGERIHSNTPLACEEPFHACLRAAAEFKGVRPFHPGEPV